MEAPTQNGCTQPRSAGTTLVLSLWTQHERSWHSSSASRLRGGLNKLMRLAQLGSCPVQRLTCANSVHWAITLLGDSGDKAVKLAAQHVQQHWQQARPLQLGGPDEDYGMLLEEQLEEPSCEDGWRQVSPMSEQRAISSLGGTRRADALYTAAPPVRGRSTAAGEEAEDPEERDIELKSN
jgi:hypothetical protein